MANPLEYMLWLIPEGDVLALYQEAISSLSKKLGTPLFIPHVTVGLISELSQDEVDGTPSGSMVLERFGFGFGG
jgi:hypothetical protein